MVHYSLFFSVVALCMFSASCDERSVPMTRGRAVSSAEARMLKDGLGWGPVMRVDPPNEKTDEFGKRWWQIHYAPGYGKNQVTPKSEDQQRIILVNDESGWARPVFARYVVRESLRSGNEEPSANDGSWILCLTEIHSQTDEIDLAQEAQRLNTLAIQTEMKALFSIRVLSKGTQQLIYGWQENHGIAQDESIQRWLEQRTIYGTAQWIDLSGKNTEGRR